MKFVKIFLLLGCLASSTCLISRLMAPRCSHTLFQYTPAVMEADEVATTLWTDEYLFETTVHGIIRCGDEKYASDIDWKPKFRLAYMPMRNRGEILRLILEESGCNYELEVIGFKPWAREKEGIKATTPQGKLPVLRDFDGHGNDLGQEATITRFLAEKLDLAGRTIEERAIVDMLYTFWFSTLRNQGISHDGEHFSIAALRECNVRQIQLVNYEESFRINNLTRAERSLMALTYFESYLEKTSTGFLVGRSLTYVDLGLFYILFELAEEDNIPDFATRFNLPQLGSFLQHMQERPRIKDYLQSPRRMPRYARDNSGMSLYTYVPGRFSPIIQHKFSS
mmetsp:Transcript_16364/g.27435  ORF Transcript_16364/g.27435 Transcript_16364/m.27435 type:complete len:338 (-) Transcript_16364:354-1367(-)